MSHMRERQKERERHNLWASITQFAEETCSLCAAVSNVLFMSCERDEKSQKMCRS